MVEVLIWLCIGGTVAIALFSPCRMRMDIVDNKEEASLIDAEYDAIKTKIDTIADEWLEPLGLRANWHITRRYWRNADEYLAHEAGGAETLAAGSISGAHTHADWLYLRATICFNCSACADNVDTLEMMVVHECAHALVHEMRAGTRCNCEYVICGMKKESVPRSHGRFCGPRSIFLSKGGRF